MKLFVITTCHILKRLHANEEKIEIVFFFVDFKSSPLIVYVYIYALIKKSIKDGDRLLKNDLKNE